MNPELQAGLVGRVLDHLAAGTTDMAPAERAVAAGRYLSAARYQVEQQALFRGLPLVLGEASAIANPGDFITTDDYGVPLLITRDAAGTVHALLNACTHRGSLLTTAARGCGKQAFTCPYHGWVFANDGRLRHVTHGACFPETEKDRHGLVAMPVAERHGLIWVGLEPGRPLDVARFTAEAAADLDWLELADCVAFRPFTVTCRSNWKLVVEGFVEQYHLYYAHPRVTSAYYSDAVVIDRLGPHQRLVAPRSTMASQARVGRHRWRLRPVASIAYYLFPNTMVIAHPDHVALVRIVPVTVDSCTVHWTMLIPRAASDATWTPHWERARESHLTTFAEDVALTDGIQAGMQGGAVPDTVIGRNEWGVINCIDSIDGYLDALGQTL